MPNNPSEHAAPVAGRGGAPIVFATWRERVLATLVELGLLIAAAVVVSVPLLAVPDPPAILVLILVFCLHVYWQFQNGSCGQSPGKALLGLRVVSPRNQQPIGWQWGLVRYAVALVLAFFSCGLAGVVDHLYPLRDSRRQTLHDKAVGSVVVSGQPRRRPADLLKP